MIQIIVLNDDRCHNDNLECEHGLSLLIHIDNHKILFDTGQTDIYLKNALKLGISLDDVETIVLSHGDYDHGNGLPFFPKKVNLICHPDFTKYRISKRTGHYSGLNSNFEELSNQYHLITSKEAYSVSDSIIYLGEIDRINHFEKGTNLPATDENGDTYQHLDDSGIVIKTENGIIVISGCAHSGICNTIEYAKKITQCNTVLAVMGGFHLKEVNDQTKNTIQYMKDNHIQRILLAHCTSDIVCSLFQKELPNETEIVETGKIYEF